MPAAIRFSSWILVVVVVGVTALAWLRPPADLDAADAADAAIDALASVGRDGEVVGSPVRDVHTAAEGARVDAWFVDVDVDGDVIGLRVQVDSGRLVYVDDLGDDGARVLTDPEFADLADFRHGVGRDRWVLRNAAGTAAAVLVAAVAAVIARRGPSLLATPSLPGAP